MPVQPVYFRNLYPVAESQEGYFTAKQALIAGYSNRMQHYHVSNGDWIKEARGIFRLSSFPPAVRPELLVCYLWSFNRAGVPLGVFSHETALSIFALSSWSADQLHLTVPKGFQRMVIPLNVSLHRNEIESEDVTEKYGVPVTKPLRTIVDLLVADTFPRKYLQEAALEALEQKLILRAEVKKAKLDSAERHLLEQLLKKSLN